MDQCLRWSLLILKSLLRRVNYYSFTKKVVFFLKKSFLLENPDIYLTIADSTGASTSGKSRGFGPRIRRFESFRPS